MVAIGKLRKIQKTLFCWLLGHNLVLPPPATSPSPPAPRLGFEEGESATNLLLPLLQGGSVLGRGMFLPQARRKTSLSDSAWP